MIRKAILILPFLVLSVCFTACKSKKDTAGKETLTGDFRSVQGVMNPLSCYCSNGGYVTLAEGRKVAVCFENKEKVSCSKITVTGTYITKTIKPDPASPCPAGTMTIFQVSSYSCK